VVFPGRPSGYDAHVTFISAHPPSFEPTCRGSMLAISILITNDIPVRLRGSLPRSVNGRQGGSNITIRQPSFLEQATDSSFDFHAESGYTLHSSAFCTKTSSYWLVRWLYWYVNIFERYQVSDSTLFCDCEFGSIDIKIWFHVLVQIAAIAPRPLRTGRT
jgi:hypothetical protein